MADGGGSDKLYDDLFDGLKATWSADERSAYCDGLEAHPLFMARAPTAKDMELSTGLKALQNVEYDDIDTPMTLAAEAKDKGNASFGRGPAYYGHAISFYNECLQHAAQVTVADKASQRRAAMELQSVAYANLAAIYLARQKYITALDCCESSLAHSASGNTKVLYRAAKACVQLGRAAAGAAFCERGCAQLSAAVAGATAAPAGAAATAADGAKLERELAAFRVLMVEATTLLRRQEAARAAVQAEREARNAEISTARAAVRARGVRVGRPLYRPLMRHLAGPGVDPVPRLDEEDPDSLNWPVLVMYPEVRLVERGQRLGWRGLCEPGPRITACPSRAAPIPKPARVRSITRQTS